MLDQGKLVEIVKHLREEVWRFRRISWLWTRGIGMTEEQAKRQWDLDTEELIRSARVKEEIG